MNTVVLFKVAHLSQCVHQVDVCDGFNHCTDGDDEAECDLAQCPVDCECHVLSMYCGILIRHVLNLSAFKALRVRGNAIEVPKAERGATLTLLDVSHNNITMIATADISGFPNLLILDLTRNKINTMAPYSFRDLKRLRRFYLHQYHIKVISSYVFYGMSSLTKLDLSNQTSKAIDTIQQYAFVNLVNVEHLDLSDNVIIQLAAFWRMERLKDINLNGSYLYSVESLENNLEITWNLLNYDASLCCLSSHFKCINAKRVIQMFCELPLPISLTVLLSIYGTLIVFYIYDSIYHT